jgi:hypothetical protein
MMSNSGKPNEKESANCTKTQSIDLANSSEQPEKTAVPFSDETEEHWEARKARILECAQEIRDRIDSRQERSQAGPLRGRKYLVPPLLDLHIEGEESQVLLNWVNFHPFRPSLSTLFCTPVPKRKERLLSFINYTILGSHEAVLGLIPGDSAITPVEEAAAALFASNGHPSCQLLRWMPTSISHRNNWQMETEVPLLGSRVTRGLFYLAVARVWPSHIDVFIDHLRRYPDPWERCKAAIDWRLKMERGGSIGEISHFNVEEFVEWFNLASAPEHVAAERDNFGQLWLHADRLAKSDHVVVN